jgi:hypothetical protein
LFIIYILRFCLVFPHILEWSGWKWTMASFRISKKRRTPFSIKWSSIQCILSLSSAFSFNFKIYIVDLDNRNP